jgi:hypothetical protein
LFYEPLAKFIERVIFLSPIGSLWSKVRRAESARLAAAYLRGAQGKRNDKETLSEPRTKSDAHDKETSPASREKLDALAENNRRYSVSQQSGNRIKK